MDFNLDAYFQRVGYKGTSNLDLNTVKKLCSLHTQTIAFENLNPLLGIPVKIDQNSLQNKMVYKQRGGDCYEHNLLFYHVLQTIGFKVTPFPARVLKHQSEGDISPKTHIFLQVLIGDDKFLTDVGFGKETLTGPIPFEMNKIHRTPHRQYRIQEKSNHHLMQSLTKRGWENMYSFLPRRFYFSDCKVANWYVSTHPDSPFTNGLIAARAGNKCTYTLSNNKFKVHHLDGKSELRVLKSVEEIKEILKDIFKIDLPDVDNLRSSLSSVLK